MDVPETRYAKTADGVYIAYQTVGNGPLDLVLVCYLLHVEHIWTGPSRRGSCGASPRSRA